MKMILAVDLGSTCFKAAVFDKALKMTGTGRGFLHYRYDSGGVVELPTAAVEKAFRSAVHEAVSRSHVRPADISSIAITSQAQTFTVCAENGKPKIPFISWLDTRPKQSRQTDLADFGSHCGFNKQIPALLVSKLLFIQKKTGGRLVGRNDRVFVLPSWFVWKLTGKAVTDDNQAAMTGLYSLVSKKWWNKALKRCGITEQNLPALAPLASAPAKTTDAAKAFGIPSGIPVVLAGNDQTAGAWGAGLHRNKGMLITLGTAQVAYRCLKTMPPPSGDFLRGPFKKGLYYKLGADDCGGSVINWASEFLTAGKIEKYFALAAEAPAGSAGLVFEPGLGAGRGVWRGIANHHTKAHFARSVLESIVERMVAMVRRLSPGYASHPVLLAGGGSQNKLWVDMLAKRLGVRLKISSSSPLLGAAMMAAEIPGRRTKGG